MRLMVLGGHEQNILNQVLSLKMTYAYISVCIKTKNTDFSANTSENEFYNIIKAKKKQSHLQYHAIQKLSLQLKQELLKWFQLLFRNGKFPRVMVHRLQQPTPGGCNYRRVRLGMYVEYRRS